MATKPAATFIDDNELNEILARHESPLMDRIITSFLATKSALAHVCPVAAAFEDELEEDDKEAVDQGYAHCIDHFSCAVDEDGEDD